MLRSQKDVDKHVQEVFRTISNEKERNLRCYNVAKLYHKVGDHQSTKKYVELYLRDRPEVAGAHKLLGQALEGLKEYSKALEEYKCSLSLEIRQPDLVLKVCELIVESKANLKAGEAKYWIEKAEEISSNHPALFRLKEYWIKEGNGSGDHAQLAQLLEEEIKARPEHPIPRTRLLTLYLEMKRIPDAYKYAVDLETRHLFRDSIQWYLCLVDVFQAYHREAKNIDGEFYVNQLCALERCVYLRSQERIAGHSSSFMNALFALDQACFEASKYCTKTGEFLLQQCIRHVSGQLCFYLATSLLRIAKQSRTGWKEWTSSLWALLTLAYSPPESTDFQSHNFASSGKDKYRKVMKFWEQDLSFRCSQAGHILMSLPHEGVGMSQLRNWREKIFKLMFASHLKGQTDVEKSSFFMTDDRFVDINEASLSIKDIMVHDNLGQYQRPDSLQALVWLGLRYLEPASKHVSLIGTPYIFPFRLSPNFSCHVFEELKFSTCGLENVGVETLSRLDVDTFLYASVFCAAAAQDQHHFPPVSSEGKPSVLPVDLTESLCTEAQAKWWSNAYRMHSNKSRSDIGEVRMVLSRGLEVVRLYGNHGMDVRLVVLLAKLFTEKAASSSTPKDNVPDISKRAQLFWQCAISLLERMDKSQPIRMSGNALFTYEGKELSASEVRSLLEEGRHFIAVRLMKEEKFEKAIEIFEDLKNPYASYHQALIYKKLADTEWEFLNAEKATSETRTNYVMLLQKSRAALYLTLDRLRSPLNAGNHPLNGELEQHLEEVESCLAQEEPEFPVSSMTHGIMDESLTSRKFEDSLQNVSRFVNTSHHHTFFSNVVPNGQSKNHGLTSTPCKLKQTVDCDINFDASGKRLEARPSPERQEVQMRRMSLTLDKVLDQNRMVLDALDKTRSAVEDLQKQMSDLKLEVVALKQSNSRNQAGRSAYQQPDEFEYYTSHLGSGVSRTGDYSGLVVPGPYPYQPLPFPESQLSGARNVDPNLPLYYSHSVLSQNFHERQGAMGIQGSSYTLPGALPSASQSALPGQLLAPVSNIQPHPAMPIQTDNASTNDSFRKSIIGAPIISHTGLPAQTVDLSTSSGILSGSNALTSDSNRPSTISHQGGGSLTSKFSSLPVDSAPHNFQISMPPQPTIPTTESLEKSLSPLRPITTEAILPNVPMPTYSAVSSKQTDGKSTRLSTGSTGGSESFTEDADYNPCADFKPIIPLPAEITVTTGEENESVLFARRAQLFRYVDGEWKERGLGDMKILKHNVTGKPRILMRREQVHKICANHLILPEMELVPQKGTDRAWTWGANDFADGEGHIEKFCVRFKTVEDAQQFKEVFDEACKLAGTATTPNKSSSSIDLPASISTTVSKKSVSLPSPAPTKVELGGFSFISPPVLKPVEHQTKTSLGKEKENTSSPPKPSPFAGFSFTSSNSLVGLSQTPSSSTISQSTSVSTSSPAVSAPNSAASLFGSKISVTSSASEISVPVFKNSSNLLDFASIAAKSQGSEVNKKDTNFKGFEGAGSKVFGGTIPSKGGDSTREVEEDAENEEFEPTAQFNPVIPLPSLVEVRTGEEDEDVIFEERAKLLRFDSKEKQWKERGLGKMKVLKNKSTGKVRLLMRREQVHKVCCNHLITQEIQFSPSATSDKAITWSAQDFSEGEVRGEVFALKFKTSELMQTFKEVVEKVQKELDITPENSPVAASKAAQSNSAVPLSEIFKPKQGSWECSGCFTRNDAEILSCPCCSQPKPGCEVKPSEVKQPVSSQFSFGIKPASNTATNASNQPVSSFKFGTPSQEKQPSLAEMFKPKEGSWVCQACYTRCDADQFACLACEGPKPGHDNVKQTTSTFKFGASGSALNTFSFGVNNAVTQPSETKGFSLSTPGEAKSAFLFGVPNSSNSESSKGFSFGSSTAPGSTSTGFQFGASSLFNNQPSEASFGSPHKFEFKMKPQSPGKSPGALSGEEDTEDEEEEENDVGDFKPVIPLPDKVPVTTGEENETVLYSHRAKLYRFVKGEKDEKADWKERGLGEIKVLRHNDTHRPRLLMRREQVLKICLNHYILPDLELKKMDDKTWIWGAHDYSEGVLALEKFACRFKSPEIAAEFKDFVDKAKAETILPSPVTKNEEPVTSTSTPLSTENNGPNGKSVTPSMATFSFKLPASEKRGVVRSLFGSSDSTSRTDEVEVVYEAKVTPEEKTAALRLQLPENFYLYKQAPPCAGCPGCDKDSDSEQGENLSSISTQATADTKSSTFSKLPVFGSVSSFSAPSSTHIFGGTSSSTLTSATPLFGNTFGSSALQSALTSTAVNSPSTVFPMLGSKLPSLVPSNDEDEKSVPFLPISNSHSFAALAATTSTSDIFKQKDLSNTFSFAGAGSKVFGATPTGPPKKTSNEEDGADDDHDTSETTDEVPTHDPHFEPIIPLPDKVEVRTGEEEEEKVFCQRAKLYRYDSKEKQWKERGVGEMKILKHPMNGTYRLLLRREQVFKVVLNQRLNPQMRLKPLQASDQAWCWGGMNHAEDEAGVLEELAVRFKNSELAHEFKSKFEECQKLIEERGQYEVQGGEAEDDDDDDDDDEDDDDDGDYEDYEDEILFEEPGSLLIETEGNASVNAEGTIKIIASPNRMHYVEMEDSSGQINCKTPIHGDVEVQRNGNVCMWKSMDMIDEIEKLFKATFATETEAEAFQDLYSQITLEIVERTYDYVDEGED